MRKTLTDQGRLCGVDEALADIKTRRPALADIAASLALLIRARQAAASALPQTSLLGVSPNPACLSLGRPLLGDLLEGLAGEPGQEVCERFRSAAKSVLPAAAQAFPAIAPDLAKVAVALDRDPGMAAALLRGLAPGGPGMGLAARAIGASEDALGIAAAETLFALLTHEAGLLADMVDQDGWRRGHCPVCGGGPDAGLLAVGGGEESEFLIAKAGQLWLHCGQCGVLWRFPRLRCVSCGCEDHKKLELLVAGEGMQDHERAQLCHECGQYLNMVNMVDRSDRLNPEMLAAALLHLDVLAQEKGFKPLTPSPWNTLG
jgi:FdhE protein